MGSFLQSIAGMLNAKNSQGPVPSPSLAGETGMDDYLNPGMKMFGIRGNPLGQPGVGIDESGAIPRGSPGSTQGDIPEGVVQGFKPRLRPTFWQALGDQLLMHWGNKPIFEQRRYDKNMRHAMEGWSHDPEGAIAKISQFDPALAWKLHNEEADNRRADLTQQSLVENRQNTLMQRAAGAIGVALRDPANRQAAISRYNQILRANHMDDYVLQDDVDDATLESIYYGAMPPTQQEQNERRKERLAQTGADTQSKIEHRKVQEGQSAERIAQGNTRIGQAQQRIDQAQQRLSPGGRKQRAGQTYQQPNGTIVQWYSDGLHVKVKGGPDGPKTRFYVIDGKTGKVIPDPDAPQ